MTTIPSATNQTRHVRKTITFTGGAGAGAVGTVSLFTTTGAVLIEKVTAHVTTSLTDVGATSMISCGVTGSSSALLGSANKASLAAGKWWTVDGYSDTVGTVIPNYPNGSTYAGIAISGNLIITVATEDVTGGVVVFDLWYRPITDDGALAGDDIDAGYTPADVKAWLGTAAATPTVAGVPEVDLTHVAGTAATAAAGIPEVKVASIAANAVTDAAVAADVTIASVTGAVGSVTGAVGSVTGAVASVTAGVTVTTNNDKTGYGLSAAAVQAIWDAATAALTTVGSIGKKLADWVIGTSQTGDSFARIGAAGAGLTALGDTRLANLDAAVSSRSTYAGGAVASVTGAVGSVTAGVTVTTNNDKTGYGLSAAAVQAIWDALTAALTTVGSIGKKLADWTIGTAQTGDSFARLGAPAGASVSADVAAMKVDTAAIKAKTDNLPTDPADESLLEAAILAAWTTALTESYNADGVAPTPAQALFVIMQRLTEFAIASTTTTVKKLDGSTTAFTLTHDSATVPTTSVRAT